MRSMSVVEAKAHFSALLAAAEAGEEIAITRRGRVIARLVPDMPRTAADLFRACWAEGGLDIEEVLDVEVEAIPPAWD